MEEIVRMMAAMGVEAYCFTVDYVSPDGEDNYVGIHSFGADLAGTVQSLLECFREQGNYVTAIVHYPGFHTKEQLHGYASNGPTVPFKFVYMRS